MSEAEGVAGATQPEQWYGDGFKDLVATKGWESPDKVIESYQNLEKKLGSDFRIPETLKDEQWGVIYDKMGVPKSADEYVFDPRDDIQLDDGLINQFRQFAIEKKMPKNLFNDIVNFQIDSVKAAEEAYLKSAEESKEQAAQALRLEWKDNYEPYFKQSKEAAEKLGILEDLEDLGLADHPNTIKMLHKISSKLSEDTLTPNKERQEVNKEQSLKEITGSEAFKNRMHPDHGKVHKRFLELCGVG